MAEIEATVDTSIETNPTEAPEAAQETDAATELAKLKSEFAKQKAALDKATKEAGDYRKQLRAKQSAEEIAAEDQKQKDAANEAELKELRKKFAMMEISKAVMSKIGGDEAASNKIAEYLTEEKPDVDNALSEIQKIIVAREKAIRIEFGKVPAPGAGNADGPTVTAEQFAAMGYMERLDFAQKHPEEYNKLVGR